LGNNPFLPGRAIFRDNMLVVEKVHVFLLSTKEQLTIAATITPNKNKEGLV